LAPLSDGRLQTARGLSRLPLSLRLRVGQIHGLARRLSLSGAQIPGLARQPGPSVVRTRRPVREPRLPGPPTPFSPSRCVLPLGASLQAIAPSPPSAPLRGPS